MNESMAWVAVGGVALLYGATRVKTRLELSLAKHRSLTGHPRMARRMAAQLPNYGYDEAQAFDLDGAPPEVVGLRKTALARLAAEYASRFAHSLQLTCEAEGDISDMQFIAAYKVPYQFRELFGKALKTGSFVQSTAGVTLTDLDGNVFYDLTGSYGVNLFGNDFYKDCIRQGSAMVAELGPVLGSYHPVVADNAKRLKAISGMDEVSFHMSGTEAVMQAVRLARYHTKRTHLLRFCGAYHGWWGDVQPGIGNPVTERDTYTLQDMGEATLRVLRKRKDIACVLVNPLQALHPNIGAPGDSSLLDSGRSAHFDRAATTRWLKQLRQICTEKNIALIFDEVFVGFRLAPGGAQEYFGVQADMVTYGKTLGGGLPVGVVCGQHAWMKRFRDEAPADICFARGTFNAHPYVMGAMNVFLQSLETAPIQAMYTGQDARWDQRAADLNQRLAAAGVPVQVAHMSSIWTVLYTQPACYNWLLQHYLRLEGLALSWVGTGRFIFSLNYSDADFAAVAERFVRAAQAMQADGWWWHNPALTNKLIKRRVLREMLAQKF
ncbi:glutamate-1-semialdehyde 2,1-aminomutase [Rhodoferax ferrireducens]|uniref:Glutamate-1-semialdehyde 2,1-aminomutase n=1 Tax=Rhodoferax ferrireducens TaxID=192843 RepID=A0ABU2CF05_9BURK|nr:aminotransferase class III-fold pyridoxal phosphate-dependent enzyme [Rhodoferax ferrireducens]MDR7379929.1 glutamate-1-semialdehyde 2,1-aminomutase [Rhodoferax ferrireducens]